MVPVSLCVALLVVNMQRITQGYKLSLPTPTRQTLLWTKVGMSVEDPSRLLSCVEMTDGDVITWHRNVTTKIPQAWQSFWEPLFDSCQLHCVAFLFVLLSRWGVQCPTKDWRQIAHPATCWQVRQASSFPSTPAQGPRWQTGFWQTVFQPILSWEGKGIIVIWLFSAMSYCSCFFILAWPYTLVIAMKCKCTLWHHVLYLSPSTQKKSDRHKLLRQYDHKSRHKSWRQGLSHLLRIRKPGHNSNNNVAARKNRENNTAGSGNGGGGLLANSVSGNTSSAGKNTMSSQEMDAALTTLPSTQHKCSEYWGLTAGSYNCEGWMDVQGGVFISCVCFRFVTNNIVVVSPVQHAHAGSPCAWADTHLHRAQQEQLPTQREASQESWLDRV